MKMAQNELEMLRQLVKEQSCQLAEQEEKLKQQEAVIQGEAGTFHSAFHPVELGHPV